MTERVKSSAQRRMREFALVSGLLVSVTVGCSNSDGVTRAIDDSLLRVGVARLAVGSRIGGLRAVVQNLSLEGLTKIGENGRPEARLAEGWTVSADGLKVTIRLRPGVKFHDGSPVTAESVAEILRTSLKDGPQSMGPAFEDIARITAVGGSQVQISLRRPTPFAEEALDVSITKPDQPAVGTGLFEPVPSASSSELRANSSYYLGPPSIKKITVSNYPSVRSAWADMLRNKLDVLYEVSGDSVDLMERATNVSLFTFVRPYQFVMALNINEPKLRSPAIRRALNLAIDRPAVVRDAFGGHGLPSTGPVWPHHWLFSETLPKLTFDPTKAEALLAANGLTAKPSGRLEIRCLVPPDTERLALVVKRQLEAVGVVLNLQETPINDVVSALGTRNYEAVLFDGLGGPSLFRMYTLWHSGGSYNPGALGSPTMDIALDGLRHATSESQYRSAVAALQQSTVDDPAAIFLAWSERVRAVSTRFQVPIEPGQDVLAFGNLRLWRPLTDGRMASRN